MSAVRRTLIASAPVRLDFGGGWTDVPPYPEDRGGFVCNIAISRFATVRLVSSSHQPETGTSFPATVTASHSIPLVDAALRRFNAQQVSVSIANDFPVGAGLGGSSAAGVALVAALKALNHQYPDSLHAKNLIAEESRAIEVDEMGIAGGRQDHYAAAHGGALGISFDEAVTVTPVALRASTATELEDRCIVGYTGESRISSTTISAVIDAYVQNSPNVVNSLHSMKTCALSMFDALSRGDIDTLGELVKEHWTHQRSLHPAITTERIESLSDAAMKAGAIGVKALGASGGGCVLAIARRGSEAKVRAAVAQFAELLPWRIATSGVTVRDETGVMKRL